MFKRKGKLCFIISKSLFYFNCSKFPNISIDINEILVTIYSIFY